MFPGPALEEEPDDAATVVYIVEGGRPEPRPVVTGRRSPDLVEIVDVVVYYQSTDPVKLVYNVQNFVLAATKLARKLADYTVTEAGFGADLGAEKFFHIKCRIGQMAPNAVVHR